MPEIESGLKWWMRYVIVPMIGGGGIIAIVVAVIATYDKPKPPQPDRDDSNRFSLAMSAQQNTKESAPEKKSSALMFEARNDSIEGKGPWVKDRIDVVSGNYVGFQWNVPNPKGEIRLSRTDAHKTEKPVGFGIGANGTTSWQVYSSCYFVISDDTGTLAEFFVQIVGN